ncbi:hypothetical protein FACHB389_19630 [Nostoc calcicola FACHB-389]|nr:hypothetical protein FACHB389_19630 [Nostoc calcicola FACHB-389]
MFFFRHLVSVKYPTKPEFHKLFPDAALKSQLENIFVKKIQPICLQCFWQFTLQQLGINTANCHNAEL